MTKRAVTQGGTSTERKTLEHQGPVRTNGAGLLFKQAVGSAHRAAVDIRVHFEMLARGSEILGNCLRKVLRAALNGLTVKLWSTLVRPTIDPAGSGPCGPKMR